MPTIFIAGNHDLNINNESRLDGLTPIYNGIDKEYPLYYLQKTGTYRFNNLIFSLASVRDYQIIDPNIIDNPDDCLKICLYHGRVNGAVLFNGITLDGEVNKKNNKTITPSSFKGYDYALLGDIHCHQYINKEKTMAYAGSLIQQNHGESLKNHGVLHWNLVNKTSEYAEIPNDHGFISVVVKDSNIEQLQVLTNHDGDMVDYNNEVNFPKNIRLRLLLENTPNSFVQQIVAVFKKRHNVIEVVHIDNTKNINSSYDQDISFNVTQPDYQNELIEEYLKGKGDVSQTKIDMIKQLNGVANKNITAKTYITNGRWKLKRLEFSNLYSYGSNNVIDFTNANGIIGIIAANHMGKSAIIDIILYTLFDKFPRKGTLKDIINHRKNNFQCKVIFQIGDMDYVIEKIGQLSKTNRTSSKVVFYRYNEERHQREVLSEDSLVKTKAIILKYIGEYEDIIQTNISLQHNNCNFIDAENTARRKELERILQINFLDELLKKATGHSNEKKAIIKHLEKKCPYELINQCNQNIQEIVGKITHLDNQKTEYQKNINTLQKEIKELNQQIDPTVSDKIRQITEQVGSDMGEDNITDKINTIFDSNQELELQKNKIISDYQLQNLIDKTSQELTELLNKNEHKHQLFVKNQKLEISKIDALIEELYNKRITPVLVPIPSKECILEKENLVKQIASDLEEVGNEIIQLQEEDNMAELEVEIREISGRLIELEKENLPQEMVNLLEETNILDIDDTISRLEGLVSQGESSKYQELKEWLNESIIYHYLEYYLDTIENMAAEKEERIARLEEIENKKVAVIDIRNQINEKNKKKGEIEKQIDELQKWIDDAKLSRKQGKHNKKVGQEIEEVKLRKQEWIDKKDSPYLIFVESNKFLQKVRELDNLVKDNLITIEKLKLNCSQMELLQMKMKKNAEVNSIIEDKDMELEEITTALGEVEDQLNIEKSKFVSNKTKLNTFKKDVQEMKRMEKEYELYQLYSEALRNIPFILIEKIRPILEKKINDLLTVVTDFMVKIEIDGTRIDIYLDRPVYNGKPILLNNASGFERFISSLAIRLALLDISQLPKGNFIAIDEGWNSFDFNNINNVHNIFDFLKDKFDFVISISHIQSIREHCNQQITLYKDEHKYSRINQKW